MNLYENRIGLFQIQNFISFIETGLWIGGFVQLNNSAIVFLGRFMAIYFRELEVHMKI